MPFIRHTSFGRLLRKVTGGKIGGQFIEHHQDFILPPRYHVYQNEGGKSRGSSPSERRDSKGGERFQDLEDAEEAAMESKELEYTIVDWYSDSDPENPHNWPLSIKLWTSFLVFFLSFTCYLGASLYTSSSEDVRRIYGVSQPVATLGLSLYIIGYGVSPLVLAPLSEIPDMGRLPPYVVSLFLFLILCIPQALVDNFAGLMVLRFLLGVLAGPAVSNSGAVFPDFFGPRLQPYLIALWGAGSSMSPGLGPIIGNFAVQAQGWRWSAWVLLWLTGPCFLCVFLGMPETSHDYILLERARRLRALTGRDDIKSPSEIRTLNQKFSASQALFDTLIKPLEINVKDPAILFTTVYSGIVYGMYYSFFESFPIVYGQIYGWEFGVQGLAYLSVSLGLLVAGGLTCLYYYYFGDAWLAKIERERGSIPPEARLLLGLYATFCLPVGLFIFAWTANASIHWFPSLLGAGIAMIGMLIVFQALVIYLPFSYPRYTASLFAANGLARSLLAAAATVYGTPMFRSLGVSGGVSLIAGLTLVCSFGMHALYYFGPALRRRSKFAES